MTCPYKVFHLFSFSLLVVLILVSWQPLLAQSTKLNKTNWNADPKIEEVRAIVRSVNDRWARKDLKISERNLTNCGDVFTEFRRLLSEGDGTVRRYEMRYTAEDEGGNQESYYDESGRLRFVIIEASAGNGSKLRHRIYFDEGGKRLWEDHHVTGLGHHWPKTWPNSDLQLTNVRQAFSTTKGCEESKPKSKRSQQ